MPLHIIRQDITKMDCDAIVNPSNSMLVPGGGVDYAIQEAAGEELLSARRAIGYCEIGQAKITPAFNLPCKHIIHTAGPIWFGGNQNEKEQLVSCYNECLKLAAENGLVSIAFPLISSGTYGYPKDQVLKVAIEAITDFLFSNEMTIYLVVYDKTAYEFSKKLFADVKSYIDDHYMGVPRGESQSFSSYLRRMASIEESLEYDAELDFAECVLERKPVSCAAGASLSDWLDKMDESFSEALFRFIDEKGMTDVECYKKANIDKKTFSKIKCQVGYKPSKNTVIAFAIALELTLEETQHLLKTVGFTLSHSNLFDLIIEFFITKGVYDIFLINETLFEFDQVCLGVIA